MATGDTTCYCANPQCSITGCQKQGAVLNPRPAYGWTIPITASPVGCICPPTSEKTCQNPNCGRKPHSYTVTNGTVSQTPGSR